MDDRKKTIKALEDQKRETQKAAYLILEQLGEHALVRLKAQGMTHLPEVIEYCRLLQDRAESDASIAGIEQDMLRLKTLQDGIAAKEQEHTGQTKQLRDGYVRLGEILLAYPALDHRYGADKQQIELLIPKIRSLETRLEQLNDTNNANVFSWIGKNAQTMVLQSLLETSQDGLRQIYERLGEHYMRSEGGIPEADGTIAAIQTIQANADLLAEDLGRLKAACRKIGATFGPDGNPCKRIQGMEKHIARIKGELRMLYARVGTHAAVPAGSAVFAAALGAEDAPLLAEAEAILQTKTHIESRIEKIKAAISIDDEQAEIEKLHKAVTQHRRRIAVSEQAIRELEDRITRSRQHIEDLTRWL